MNAFLNRLGIELPIIQAPMAGASTPEMASAVSNAGGLGSIGVGNVDASAARKMIHQVRALTNRPFNVNVFCHKPVVVDLKKESAWIELLSPHFNQFGSNAPTSLREIYGSFVNDDAMLAMFLEERPPIVSFHFGLPSAERIAALKSAGIILLATATSLSEARYIEQAKVDAVVAQGYEAGGHRGVFDPEVSDERLSALELTRQLSAELTVPIIAAGGIMTGSAIASAINAGAGAAQLGTAFLLCPESSVDVGYRQALSARPAPHTVMTRAISGRPARSIENRFTAIGESVDPQSIPSYPRTYSIAKELHAAAKRKGEFGYGAQWSGQSLSQIREMRAADLIKCLNEELEEAQAILKR